MKRVRLFSGIIAGGIILWDVVLLYSGEPTISSSLKDLNWVAAGAGFVVGHIWSPVDEKTPRWVSLGAGGSIILASTILDMSPTLSLILGGLGGAFFWTNPKGKEPDEESRGDDGDGGGSRRM